MLKQLGNYTIEHFRSEESYMQEIGYPKLETHKGIHRELIANLRKHVERFEAGTGRLSEELLGF